MPTPEQLERLAFTEVMEGTPLHQLVTEHRDKPAPDSRDWWREVAQGLGVRAFELKAQRDELLAALKAVSETGDDCPMCDRGRLRNPQKTHCPECPFGRAQAVIAKAEGK